MDTEKYIKQQKHLDEGKSPSDEGPYYHHTWWEAYKGGVKGKLGGLIIGAVVGGVVGIAVAGAAAFFATGVLTFGAVAATIGGFSAAGLMYGAHEFGDVGKVTGAVSAGLQQAESRIKTSEGLEFAQIKQEIRELKSLVKGEPVDKAEAVEVQKTVDEYDDQDYRKSHYAKLNPPKINSFAFWKVALVGLVIGAAAGVLLGYSGITHDILKETVGKVIDGNLMKPLLDNVVATSAIIFGAMGASFGLNRDIFRKIFDKTDLWFKGITHGKGHELVRKHQVSAGIQIREELNGHGKNEERPEVATAVIPDSNEPVKTQYRDMVLARAQEALRNADQSAMTRH